MTIQELGKPGRIRLYRADAACLVAVVHAELLAVLLRRKERPAGATALPHNQRVRSLQRVLGELERMRGEMGWDSAMAAPMAAAANAPLSPP